MAEPYGTIAKYRNALAIKKHNAIIQPWASAMALDVAAVFWATWKGIEERLPEGDEIIEAEKPRDSRDLKNKYSAIIRVEVKRHSAELQRVIENYIYRVWLAGAVEQCRDLGCTGWFFSSLSKSSTSSESASAPDGASLKESENFYVLGTDPTMTLEIGVYVGEDGKASYACRSTEDAYTPVMKWSPTNGNSEKQISSGFLSVSDVHYSPEAEYNTIRTTKQGGEKLPGAKTVLKKFGVNQQTKTKSKTNAHSSKTVKVKADKTGWVSLPNLRAQSYAKKHAAEAVTQINDTTRKEIARIVSDGVKSGSSYNDIAKAIKNKFEEFAVPMPQKHVSNRAVLVAVTELANAYCEGNAQVGNYLQDNGVKMMKAWQTLEDNRVSDGCKENERVGWIPIKKEFPSGHMHPPRFPGCRCDFLQDILEEDMLGKPIDALYGKQYTNSAVKTAKSSPSKTVSSQVQQVTPSKKTKSGKAASKRARESSTPKWETWDMEGVDDELSSVNIKIFKGFLHGDEKEFLANGGASFEKMARLMRSKTMSFSKMPEDLKYGIVDYTGDAYVEMNEYLRQGRPEKFRDPETESDTKISVQMAEQAIHKYGVTTHPLVVNRGFDGDFCDDWKEGEIREELGFVSTSVQSSGFSRHNNWHVYVPANKGSGIYVDGESQSSDEFEYLIAPGSKFRVHHIEQNDKGGKDFWLELIPEEK